MDINGIKIRKGSFGSLGRHHAGGFTLVELLLVLVILALIGGLVLPGIIGKAEGDIVSFQAPSGEKTFEVLEVKYI